MIELTSDLSFFRSVFRSLAARLDLSDSTPTTLTAGFIFDEMEWEKWMIIECLAVFEHNNKKTSFERFNFRAQQRFSFILALRGNIAHQRSSTGTD